MKCDILNCVAEAEFFGDIETKDDKEKLDKVKVQYCRFHYSILKGNLNKKVKNLVR